MIFKTIVKQQYLLNIFFLGTKSLLEILNLLSTKIENCQILGHEGHIALNCLYMHMILLIWGHGRHFSSPRYHESQQFF